MALVYVACGDSRDIASFRLDPSHPAMIPLGVTPLPGGTQASASIPLATHPNGTRLYAALRDGEPYRVHSLAIDRASGALTHLGTADLPDSMCHLLTDRAGRTLLAASYGGGIVTVGAIDEDGVVRAPPAQVTTTPPKAHCTLVAPDDAFVHAAVLGADAILTWVYDPAHGLLGADAPVVTRLHEGAGPRHLAFGRGGAILYAVNELDGTVSVFDRDAASGSLVHRQTVSALAAPIDGSAAAADLHLRPDGRFLYASVRADSHIAVFAVASDGALTPVGRFAVEAKPRGFAIDPSGQCLVCAGQEAGGVGLYALNQEGGGMTTIGFYQTGGNPNWVEIVA